MRYDVTPSGVYPIPLGTRHRPKEGGAVFTCTELALINLMMVMGVEAYQAVKQEMIDGCSESSNRTRLLDFIAANLT